MSTESKNFPIPNVALYAKLWYKRSNDVWEDIRKCLIGDNYDPYTKKDTLSIVMRHTAPLMSRRYDLVRYTQELLEAVNPHSCWRYGYYTKDHTWAIKNWPELKTVDFDVDTAMLWFYLSWLQGEEVVNLGGKLPAADPKVLELKNEPFTEVV